MNIISWNVNGIRAILNKGFKEFVKKENPDIICLQETKAHPSQVDKILEDYEHHFWNSAEKKGYSGTAIFSKKKPINVHYGINKKEHDNEGRVITATFEKFTLVNVYTPNSQRGLARLDYRHKWNQDFLNYVKKISGQVIICGDLNVAHTEIDLANPKSNYNVTAGYTQIEIDDLTKLIKAGFIDTFRKHNKEPNHYTYWSYMFGARQKNIGWRIDYFLTNGEFKKSEILNKIMGSDHCPIKLIL